jgi:hypothetical protein
MCNALSAGSRNSPAQYHFDFTVERNVKQNLKRTEGNCSVVVIEVKYVSVCRFVQSWKKRKSNNGLLTRCYLP